MVAANMAHVRQSRPDAGLDFQVKVLVTLSSCSLFARKRSGDTVKQHQGGPGLRIER